MDSSELAASSPTGLSLADEFARSARAADAALPVLRHLLASDGPSLVSEAVVARVRGMLRDLAGQVLGAGRGAPAPGDESARRLDALTERLASDDALLAHIHTLALEGQLAERCEQHLSLDPVLSPLLQELIASDDPVVAELAMTTLAAQSRFMQSQRRMELPLSELPAELFHSTLRRGAEAADPAGAEALARLAAHYDEAATRLVLFERLVAAMRRAVVACLSFERAGLALFAHGLAALANVPRAEAVLACHESQTLRLALMLRAAGLDRPGIERPLRLLSAPFSASLDAIAALAPQQARTELAGARPTRTVERG